MKLNQTKTNNLTNYLLTVLFPNDCFSTQIFKLISVRETCHFVRNMIESST